MNKSFLIIGAGPAGYQSALEIRSAFPEAEIKLIEKEKLGGTCLNTGCIPSKLLSVITDETQYLKLLKKNKTLLIKGLEQKLLNAGVETISGAAQIIIRDNDFSISVEDGILKANYLILATGSKPRKLMGISDSTCKENHSTEQYLNSKFIDSDSFFAEENLANGFANSYCFIGGGYIGVELASMLAKLGKQVRILEIAEDILLFLDKDLRDRVKSNLSKQGIIIETGISNIDYSAITEEKIFLSIGRERVLPEVCYETNSSNFSIQDTDSLQKILEQEQLKDRVFILGDLNGQMPLAHYAYAEAKALAKYLKANNTDASKNTEFKIHKQHFQRPILEHIPQVIFMDTEFAHVGFSLEEVMQKFANNFFVIERNWAENAKARISGYERGYTRLIFEKNSQRLISCSLLGHSATDLISIAIPLLTLGTTYEQIKSMCFPHPTLGELFALE